MLRTTSIVHINIPNYPELNVRTFYEYYKSKPELKVFLQDYKSVQRSEREYLFNIIENISPQFQNNKIKEAHKKKLSEAAFEDCKKIEIREDILKEIVSAKYESIRI